jgi:ABC-type branched-subunit amino acid transport system substrate-binding protein
LLPVVHFEEEFVLTTIFRTLLASLLLLSAAAHAQAPGVGPDKIRLGQSAPLTGPAAQLGIQMQAGLKTYFDWVNSQGGVYGRKIELVTLDDGYEADRAAETTRKLIGDEYVFALIGYVGTPTSMAALPIFTAANVPFFGPFTGAESLRNPVSHDVFNVRASYFDETERIVGYLVSSGLKKIAVFYQNDAYGKAGLAGVERAMTKRNMKIAATGTVERNSVDVTAAIKAIAPAAPEATIMISAYKSCAQFIKSAKKAEIPTQFFNVSFVGSKALADELGEEGLGVVISQVVPYPYVAKLPVVREYQDLLKKGGSTDYNFSSMEGFIDAKIFVEALKRTGKDLTRERLIATLESMRNYDTGGFAVSFSPASHSGSSFVDLTMVNRGGRFVSY